MKKNINSNVVTKTSQERIALEYCIKTLKGFGRGWISLNKQIYPKFQEIAQLIQNVFPTRSCHRFKRETLCTLFVMMSEPKNSLNTSLSKLGYALESKKEGNDYLFKLIRN